QVERVDLMDGVKLFDKDSWVLVLPDSVEPIFHVYAESPDNAASRDLALRYAQKIAQIANS
ncbi:MAG: phosphoglucosamine mutase, partial [Fimbriimonas sp.]